MRELLTSSKVLDDIQFSLLQLVENGLCKYSDFKDGSLDFRDIKIMLEYLDIKTSYLNWKYQHDVLRNKKVM